MLKSTSQIALYSTIDTSGGVRGPPKTEDSEFSHSLGHERTQREFANVNQFRLRTDPI